MKIKGYKAFNPGLVCNGKQYAENTTFEEPEADLCKCGMHFCQNPVDVLAEPPGGYGAGCKACEGTRSRGQALPSD